MAYPTTLAGEEAYHVDWIDQWLPANGIEPVNPSKINEDRDARPVEFECDAYCDRSIVERLIGSP